jgi:DegV family protein with EDD domain
VVRILTNPGANLPPEVYERYGIHLSSSTIIVDGEVHDARDGIALADVDRWVKEAREYPYVLGSSAAEFAKLYLEIGVDRGEEILVVMSSRKIIQSYDAACSAARTVGERPGVAKLAVVDSAMTDVAMGLPVLVAAAAAAAGLSIAECAAATRKFADGGRFFFVPHTLDYLIKGGRASFLRGWAAKLLGLRPVLAFDNGEPAMAGKCGAKDDLAEVLAQWLTRAIPAGPVWIGIAHGGVPDDAARLGEALRRHYDVELMLIRETTPTVYLHAGPGILGAVVFPLTDLPWHPPADAL